MKNRQLLLVGTARVKTRNYITNGSPCRAIHAFIHHYKHIAHIHKLVPLGICHVQNKLKNSFTSYVGIHLNIFRFRTLLRSSRHRTFYNLSIERGRLKMANNMVLSNGYQATVVFRWGQATPPPLSLPFPNRHIQHLNCIKCFGWQRIFPEEIGGWRRENVRASTFFAAFLIDGIQIVSNNSTNVLPSKFLQKVNWVWLRFCLSFVLVCLVVYPFPSWLFADEGGRCMHFDFLHHLHSKLQYLIINICSKGTIERYISNV